MGKIKSVVPDTHDTPVQEIIEEAKKTSDVQKKATRNYRIANRDKINEQRKQYYHKRKLSDPTFLEYKRQKAREYYAKKKAAKKVEVTTPVEEVKVEEPKIEVVEEVKPDIIEVPKRKKRVSKK